MCCSVVSLLVSSRRECICRNTELSHHATPLHPTLLIAILHALLLLLFVQLQIISGASQARTQCARPHNCTLAQTPHTRTQCWTNPYPTPTFWELYETYRIGLCLQLICCSITVVTWWVPSKFISTGYIILCNRDSFRWWNKSDSKAIHGKFSNKHTVADKGLMACTLPLRADFLENERYISGLSQWPSRILVCHLYARSIPTHTTIKLHL